MKNHTYILSFSLIHFFFFFFCYNEHNISKNNILLIHIKYFLYFLAFFESIVLEMYFIKIICLVPVYYLKFQVNAFNFLYSIKSQNC